MEFHLNEKCDEQDSLGFTFPSEAMVGFSQGAALFGVTAWGLCWVQPEFPGAGHSKQTSSSRAAPPGALLWYVVWASSFRAGGFQEAAELRSSGSRGELILHPNGRGSLCCPRRVAGWSLPRRLSMSAPVLPKPVPLLLATELTLLAVLLLFHLDTERWQPCHEGPPTQQGMEINFLSSRKEHRLYRQPSWVCMRTLELAFKCQLPKWPGLQVPRPGLLELQDFLSSNMVNPMPTGMNSSPSLCAKSTSCEFRASGYGKKGRTFRWEARDYFSRAHCNKGVGHHYLIWQRLRRTAKFRWRGEKLIGGCCHGWRWS